MSSKFLIKINNKIVSFYDTPSVVERLNNDENYLDNYIIEAIESRRQEVAYLAYEETDNITLERVTATCESIEDIYCLDQNLPSTSTARFSVWSNRGKTSAEDQLATELLLKLRNEEKFKKKFNDKKTIKSQLWHEIAEKMLNEGFLVDKEKCQQKFYNLQKAYIKYASHMRQTGSERKDEPEFYELLHAILGTKDKVNLSHVQDTLNTKDIESGNDMSQSLGSGIAVNEQPDIPRKTMDSKCSSHLKPKRQTQKPSSISKRDILDAIKEESQKQDAHNEKVLKLLVEQNAQRQQLINIFQSVAEQKKTQTKKFLGISINLKFRDSFRRAFYVFFHKT